MGAPDHPLGPLHAVDQWIVVLLVPLNNGKTDKLPVDYRTGSVGVDAHNRNYHTEFTIAKTLAEKWGPQFTVGFVLTENDPFFCLDIDNALQPDGTWSPLSQSLCAALPNTVIEVSQSGRGLHVWGQGIVPPHSARRIDLAIEFYTEKRFIAIGHSQVGDMSQPCPTVRAFVEHYFPPRERVATVGDGPAPEWRGPEDDDDLIRRALQSKSARSTFGGGASFADLWECNTTVLGRAYPPDQSSSEPFDRSSADAALAQHLAFWTGRDVERIGRLMRQSALLRNKWERDDYFLGTIENACEMQREVLQDKEPPAPPVPVVGDVPKQSAVEGDTFLSAAQQAEMFKGCVYVLDEHKVLIPGGHLLKSEQFRAHFGGYTFAMDARNERTTRNAFEAFTESQVLRPPRADGTCFFPQRPYGELVQDAGRIRVNTYWPVQVPRKKGDVTPFLNHAGKLLPVERDRQIALAYFAAAVQRQGTKFQWAPVIQGVEGNGKTLFSRCVAAAIGRRYVHWPKANKLAKDFNKWMRDRTLYCVEDIHVSDRADVIEQLKPMITGGDGLEIEAKGVDQISTEICGNFIFNTNHRTGIRKTKNDRRFCWLACAQQEAEHLARDGMDGDYFPRLYNWLDRGDGYAIVAEFLWTYPIPPELDPAQLCNRAPRTSTTDDAIEAGLGRVEQAIMEAVDDDRPGFAGGWISSTAMRSLLERRKLEREAPRSEEEHTLRALGYVKHPGLAKNSGQVCNPVAPDGGKPRLYVQVGHPALALTAPAEIARAYTRAQGVQ